MDTAAAQRLASSADPTGIGALRNRNDDPAVARAVAGQFGAFLMQGLMQSSDGSAMAVAEGVGGSTVSALFATEMGRLAMTGDKLGLADLLLKSMQAKADAATPAAAPSDSAPAAQPAASAVAALMPLVRQTATAGLPTAAVPPAAAFSLASYWLGQGMRPVVTALAAAAAAPSAAPTPSPLALPTPPASDPGNAMTPVPAARLQALANLMRIDRSLLPGEPSPPAAAPTPAAQPSVSASAAPADFHATIHPDVTSFMQGLAPALRQAAEQLQVSARVLLAQVALETGWGRSVVGNNVFGVKADPSWSGSVVQAMTHEVVGNRLTQGMGSFRAYPSRAEAVQDYVALVSRSPRYRGALGLGDDAARYGAELAVGSYATDPGYGAKLAAVAQSPLMTQAMAALNRAAPAKAGSIE